MTTGLNGNLVTKGISPPEKAEGREEWSKDRQGYSSMFKHKIHLPVNGAESRYRAKLFEVIFLPLK